MPRMRVVHTNMEILKCQKINRSENLRKATFEMGRLASDIIVPGGVHYPIRPRIAWCEIGERSCAVVRWQHTLRRLLVLVNYFLSG